MSRSRKHTRNRLLIVGPAEMERTVRLAGARHMLYNRTPEFSAFFYRIEKGLQSLFRTRNDVLVLASSGTGAMEAAIVNLLSPRDQALVLSAGRWGEQWHAMLMRFGVDSRIVRVPFGSAPSPALVKQKLSARTKAVFVTACETSSGNLIDLKAIGSVIARTPAVLVVDAVSSLGADDLEVDRWHCDVVIAASQKGLAIAPGLSFITLSRKAWRLVERSRTPRYYFDLKLYRDNLRRGQTPFTPALSLLYQLHERLQAIRSVGSSSLLQRQRRKADYLRAGLEKLGLSVIGDSPSGGVTGIRFPGGVDAFAVVQALRRRYRIEIAPGPGENRSLTARVGLFGSLTYADIDRLLVALRQILRAPAAGAR